LKSRIRNPIFLSDFKQPVGNACPDFDRALVAAATAR
jgi:hypothetical protein